MLMLRRARHRKEFPLQVRSANAGDVPFIVAANERMAQETEGRVLDRKTLEAGVKAVFSEPQRGFYQIAEVDGEAAATLLITFEWSDSCIVRSFGCATVESYWYCSVGTTGID